MGFSLYIDFAVKWLFSLERTVQTNNKNTICGKANRRDGLT